MAPKGRRREQTTRRGGQIRKVSETDGRAGWMNTEGAGERRRRWMVGLGQRA